MGTQDEDDQRARRSVRAERLDWLGRDKAAPEEEVESWCQGACDGQEKKYELGTAEEQEQRHEGPRLNKEIYA